MKINKNLILVGMMGSGKSTIGRLLSNKLNLRFFDIDLIIQKKKNMKISEIFEKKGEFFFRNIEEKLTLKFLNKNKCVISIGGGSFINEKIRKKILNQNISFWLNWKSETLLKRIKNSKKRPIASNLTYNELKNLINKRSKIYAKSNYKIECENMSKIEIVKKIISIYETIQNNN